MPEVPIDTRHLFKPLHNELIHLLKSLNEEDWNKQTVAKKWKVKDVVSHILDGQLRVLSIQRDKYFGEMPPKVNNYESLVNWLNGLNSDWVKATKRLSPDVLIFLLESIGEFISKYFTSLDPFENAIFSVAWAGESRSYNWMHIAREYTEYWHHQQQIRDVVNIPGIMTREFFFPVLNTFFQALPFTFEKVQAKTGSVVEVIIETDAGGKWYIEKQSRKWILRDKVNSKPVVSVTIPIDISWVLFSKSIRASEIIDQISIEGDRKLGLKVLDMVSVMA